LALGVTNRDPGVDLRIALLEPLIGLLGPPPLR
jgi:hypothetical protein